MSSILVLAGVNGAGKSSVLGALPRSFFNPDSATRRIQSESGCSIDEANARAWEEGRRLLEDAIASGESYAFETTLGGNTIPAMLESAAKQGFDVYVWFVGLSTPEQHIARVGARVAAGGHDIPEEKIRERWDSSRRNIIMLMPVLSELRVFDNSAERDPVTGLIPEPRLLLHFRRGEIVAPTRSVLAQTPEWAKAIVMQAIKLQRT
jgi:predicted ABC-type ATPase